MRRGPGLAGLDKKKTQQKQFTVKGSEVKEAEISQMKDQLVTFKTNLEEFAKKYKKDINKNPEFRKHFGDMCNKIGVDPLASNKGFWSEMLGVGDFYYELAVQIIEICMHTRERNGGLIDINELCEYLIKKRGKNAQSISVDDIERASKKLKTLGSGFQLLSVGNQKMIQSVPCELNNDHTTVLVLAQEKHFVNPRVLESELKWKKDRIDSVLELLVREGMAWIDDQSETGERAFWFPSLMGGSLIES